MTTEIHDWDGCLMCAVRTLTEGRPKNWGLRVKGEDLQPGDSVTGVVMRMGEQPSAYEARVPYVDLWVGGIDRVRVAGHGVSLREELLAAEPQVGDTMTIRFEGAVDFETKNGSPGSFRKFSVGVKRGHH